MRADAIELWLDRSSPLPITLSVDMVTCFDYMVEWDEDEITPLDTYEDLFLLFANYGIAERWEDVRFILAPIVAHGLEKLMEENKILYEAEKLRTLSVELKPIVKPKANWLSRTESSGPFAFEVPFGSFIAQCSSLQNLTFVGWTRPGELKKHGIAWGNLTHLELTQHERTELSDPFLPLHIILVLREASSTLQSFTLKCCSLSDVDGGGGGGDDGGGGEEDNEEDNEEDEDEDEDDFDPDCDFITLPQLRTLHVHLKAWTAYEKFRIIFDHITAPSLLDLSIRFRSRNSDLNNTPEPCSLACFLSRSECRLRRLDVRLNIPGPQAELSDRHITQCLRIQPGLIDLQVTSPVWFDYSGQTQTLVNRLTLGSPESLCSDLETIRFTRCFDYDEAYLNVLVALARSRSSLPLQNTDDGRRAPSVPLKTFHARFPWEALGPPGFSWDKDHHSLFDEIRKAGIDFQLTFPDEPQPADPPEIQEYSVEEEDEFELWL
ncbi:hypothetical protein AAF712_007332 [Marasmius tenuissimus]|uniref:Uncharacterized protein n=1 Tax=Marasmius tenuissimus TaxID=585030 RepID=A0ABR2ZVE3_9AGAR